MNNSKTKLGAAFRAAFPVTIPVLTGFFVLGLAYGILMSSKGYGPLWSAFFAIIDYCGSMQFVAITFLTGAFAPLAVFLMAIMVNARHLFYGLSMLDKYKGTGKFKPFLIYVMSDETFAINSSATVPEGIDKKYFYFATSLLDYLYWIIPCFLGGIIGNYIPESYTKGLDFALTALFVVLFLEQLKSRNKSFCGIIGISAGFAALTAFGADNMVIPAMIFILVALLAGRRKLCD